MPERRALDVHGSIVFSSAQTRARIEGRIFIWIRHAPWFGKPEATGCRAGAQLLTAPRSADPLYKNDTSECAARNPDHSDGMAECRDGALSMSLTIYVTPYMKRRRALSKRAVALREGRKGFPPSRLTEGYSSLARERGASLTSPPTCPALFPLRTKAEG